MVPLIVQELTCHQFLYLLVWISSMELWLKYNINIILTSTFCSNWIENYTNKCLSALIIECDECDNYNFQEYFPIFYTWTKLYDRKIDWKLNAKLIAHSEIDIKCCQFTIHSKQSHMKVKAFSNLPSPTVLIIKTINSC